MAITMLYPLDWYVTVYCTFIHGKENPPIMALTFVTRVSDGAFITVSTMAKLGGSKATTALLWEGTAKQIQMNTMNKLHDILGISPPEYLVNRGRK